MDKDFLCLPQRRVFYLSKLLFFDRTKPRPEARSSFLILKKESNQKYRFKNKSCLF